MGSDMNEHLWIDVLRALARSHYPPLPQRPRLRTSSASTPDFSRLRSEALLSQLGELPGMQMPGNVDLYRQPVVPNADGTTSTVDSFSVNIDGREVLLPTVTPDGRHLSEEDAIREYYSTGRHLGQFDTPQNATRYASRLHDDYAAGKYRK